MSAKRQRFSNRARDARPTNDLLPGALGAQWLDAKLDDVSSDSVRSWRLLIVLGAVALAWIGCIGTLMLRPAAAPEMATAPLPPLASAVPSPGEDASNSPSQTLEPGWSTGSEASPFNSDISRRARLEAVPPRASTTTPTPGKVPRPPAREPATPEPHESAPLAASGRSDAAAWLRDRGHPHNAGNRLTPNGDSDALGRTGHPAHALTITTGHRYAATVNLSGMEALADNAYIASYLSSAGFTNVTVTGSGGTRSVTATWTGATITRAADPHLSNVRDLSG
jgi:hypothetical protein